MPEITTNYALPYPEQSDFVDVAGDIEGLAKKLDQNLASIVQTVTQGMVTGNSELGVNATYNTSSKKLDFVLDIPYIEDEIKDMLVHTLHENVEATYNNTTNQVILKAQAGGGGGGTGSASLTDIWWLGV
jgi:hypothetical protein